MFLVFTVVFILYIFFFHYFFLIFLSCFSHIWCLWSNGQETARLLCPWDSQDKNVGFHVLLQWIFPTQGSNSHLLCLHISYGSKITEEGDCSHEIKRHLLLERKAILNSLDSIFKSRDLTLSKKIHIVKDMVSPVVMYRCKTWTIKKAEQQRIDAFKLWCWRRL